MLFWVSKLKVMITIKRLAVKATIEEVSCSPGRTQPEEPGVRLGIPPIQYLFLIHGCLSPPIRHPRNKSTLSLKARAPVAGIHHAAC